MPKRKTSAYEIAAGMYANNDFAVNKNKKAKKEEEAPPSADQKKKQSKAKQTSSTPSRQSARKKPVPAAQVQHGKTEEEKEKEEEEEAMSEDEDVLGGGAVNDNNYNNDNMDDEEAAIVQGNEELAAESSDEIICCFEEDEEEADDAAAAAAQYQNYRSPPEVTQNLSAATPPAIGMKTNRQNYKKKIPEFGGNFPQPMPAPLPPPPQAHSSFPQAVPAPLPPPPQAQQHRQYYAPGLAAVQESLGGGGGGGYDEAQEADDDLPLAPDFDPNVVVHDNLPWAPAIGPDVVVHDDLPLAPAIGPDVVVHDEVDIEPLVVQIPKASKLGTALMWGSIMFVLTLVAAALFFASLESNMTNVSTSLAVAGTLNLAKCPPGGHCQKDGTLTACGPYLKIMEGSPSSFCVLDDDAAVQVRMIDRLLHKYSFEHIRRTTAKDENPYFAREEQGRPLYYLASVAKALNVPADAALLYTANLLHEHDENQKLFLVSDGFLVGVHPHRAIQGGVYAYAQVWTRTVASALAFVVWSVLVTVYAIYSSWLRQAPVLTVGVTFVGLASLKALQVYLATWRAREEKKNMVLKYRRLAYTELYRTPPGPVEADVVFARVAMQAFPTSRAKREELKAKVWRHILNDADKDDRVDVTKTTTTEGATEGGTTTTTTKTFWEWKDELPPAN